MKLINIQAIPSQSFSINIAGYLWDFRIKETNGVMCVDLKQDDEQILLGQKLVSSQPVSPYGYINNGGSFFLLTLDQDLPHYTKFGVSQFLYFLSSDEMDIINEDPPLFNGLAKKPLRYDVSKTQYNYVYLATEDGDILATEDGDLFVLGG